MPESSGKNWVVEGITKIGPTILSTLVFASIAWIGTKTTESSTTLAVLSVNIESMNKKIDAINANSYTIPQAIADKTYVVSEISHLRDTTNKTDDEVKELQRRVLELERKQQPK